LVGDEALADLEPATGLVTLNLNMTGVTDRGLRHFYGMKKLREVELEVTDVSDEGAAALKRHCPSLSTISFHEDTRRPRDGGSVGSERCLTAEQDER
jgi:hypothetical protein